MGRLAGSGWGRPSALIVVWPSPTAANDAAALPSPLVEPLVRLRTPELEACGSVHTLSFESCTEMCCVPRCSVKVLPSSASVTTTVVALLLPGLGAAVVVGAACGGATVATGPAPPPPLATPFTIDVGVAMGAGLVVDDAAPVPAVG